MPSTRLNQPSYTHIVDENAVNDTEAVPAPHAHLDEETSALFSILNWMNNHKIYLPIFLYGVISALPNAFNSFLYPSGADPEDVFNPDWLHNQTAGDLLLDTAYAASGEITNLILNMFFLINIMASFSATRDFLKKNPSSMAIGGALEVCAITSAAGQAAITYGDFAPLAEIDTKLVMLTYLLTGFTFIPTLASRTFGAIRTLRIASGIFNPVSKTQEDVISQMRYIENTDSQTLDLAFMSAVTKVLFNTMQSLVSAHEKLKALADDEDKHNPESMDAILDAIRLHDDAHVESTLQLLNELKNSLSNRDADAPAKLIGDTLAALHQRLTDAMNAYLKHQNKDDLRAMIFVEYHQELSTRQISAFKPTTKKLLSGLGLLFDHAFGILATGVPTFLTYGQKSFNAIKKTAEMLNEGAKITACSPTVKGLIGVPGGVGSALLYYVSAKDVRHTLLDLADHLQEHHTREDVVKIAACLILAASSGFAMANVAENIAKDPNNIYGIPHGTSLSTLYKYTQMLGAIIVNFNGLIKQLVLHNPELRASVNENGEILFTNRHFTRKSFLRYLRDAGANPLPLSKNDPLSPLSDALPTLKNNSLWREISIPVSLRSDPEAGPLHAPRPSQHRPSTN